MEEHVQTMNDQVRELHAQGSFAQGLELAQMVLGVVRSGLPNDHPLFLECLENVALCLIGLGHAGEAEGYLREAIEIHEARDELQSSRCARTLSLLAQVLKSQGNLSDAEPILRRVIDIQRDRLGADDPTYAASLHDLAELYRLAGRHSESETLFQDALRLFEIALGDIHPNTIACLNNIGLLQLAMGDHAAAASKLAKVCDALRILEGDESPQLGQAYVNLATCRTELGDYDAAAELYERACSILKRNPGSGHPAYATAVRGLAILRRKQARYQEAETLCSEVLQLETEAGRGDSAAHAGTVDLMASICRKTGNRERAGTLLQQALDIRERTVGIAHPDYAASLHNLALYYWWDLGQLAQAEPMYRQVLEILADTVGEQNPRYATALDNLAELYRAMRRFEAAEPLYRRSLELRRVAMGENHRDYASSLNNLGALYEETGRPENAEIQYREALRIRRVALGPTHPDYSTTLGNLAFLLASQRRYAEALAPLREALEIDEKNIAAVFRSGSERQKAEFAGAFLGQYFGFLTLVVEQFPDSKELIAEAVGLVLRRKAIVTDITAFQRQSVALSRHPELSQLMAEFNELRTTIAEKSLAGPGGGDEPLTNFEATIRRLNERAEALETEIARHAPQFALESGLRRCDLAAVSGALPPEAVLIEIVQIDPCDFHFVPQAGQSRWRSPRYLAFTLLAGSPGDVRLVDLGEAREIDKLVADFRATIADESDDLNRDMTRQGHRPSVSTADAGKQLRATVFDVLLPVCHGKSRFIIAPDGDLSCLAWDVLPLERERRVIDDYCVSYLSCGRDAVRFHVDSNGLPNAPLVAADPDFDLQGERAVAVDGPLDGMRREVADSQASFMQLPGTRDEGIQIANLLQVTPWLGAEVLKSRIVRVESPSIMHLATHGFFLAERDNEVGTKHGEPDFEATGRFAGLRLPNPLLRSGLALAGGNSWLQNRQTSTEAENGILTAEDVATIDLAHTQLVVLSACDTGLGEVRRGEGVFGLRRAFMLAGAKSLVLSLWKVPDQETRELMQDFYTRLLKGEPRAEALRGAQLAMKSRYPDPYYWGAFICEGNPNPLSDRSPALKENSMPTEGYFEVERPWSGEAVCSDPECPCPETSLGTDNGYLWVSPQLVEFRRDLPSIEDVHRRYAGRMVAFGPGVAAPLAMCEQAARKRNLDLAVAQRDYIHWQQTGEVPLRATPVPTVSEAPEQKIEVVCPHCQKVVLVKASAVGRSALCKKCWKQFTVEATAPISTPEPQPQPEPEPVVAQPLAPPPEPAEKADVDLLESFISKAKVRLNQSAPTRQVPALAGGMREILEKGMNMWRTINIPEKISVAYDWTNLIRERQSEWTEAQVKRAVEFSTSVAEGLASAELACDMINYLRTSLEHMFLKEALSKGPDGFMERLSFATKGEDAAKAMETQITGGERIGEYVTQIGSAEDYLRQGLAKMGRRVVPHIAGYISQHRDDKSTSTLQLFIGALAQFKSEGAQYAPALLEIVRKRFDKVGNQAAYLLSSAEHPEVVAAITDRVRALKSDPQATTSLAQSIGALGACKSRALSSAPLLIELVKSKEADVQDAAISALGYVGDPSMIPLLKKIRDGKKVLAFLSSGENKFLYREDARNGAGFSISMISDRYPTN